MKQTTKDTIATITVYIVIGMIVFSIMYFIGGKEIIKTTEMTTKCQNEVGTDATLHSYNQHRIICKQTNVQNGELKETYTEVKRE